MRVSADRRVGSDDSFPLTPKLTEGLKDSECLIKLVRIGLDPICIDNSRWYGTSGDY